jgi:hypothetical protein
MGGTTQQKNTTTAQNQTSTQTQQQQQQSQQQQQQSGATSSALTPWAGNAGLLNSIFSQLGGIPTGLTPAETNALNQWGALAGAGNPYAGQIGGVANTLLAGGGPDRTAMVNNAYQQFILREIERHRESFARTLRRALEDVEDAEFEVITPGGAVRGEAA